MVWSGEDRAELRRFVTKQPREGTLRLGRGLITFTVVWLEKDQAWHWTLSTGLAQEQGLSRTVDELLLAAAQKADLIPTMIINGTPRIAATGWIEWTDLETGQRVKHLVVEAHSMWARTVDPGTGQVWVRNFTERENPVVTYW